MVYIHLFSILHYLKNYLLHSFYFCVIDVSIDVNNFREEIYHDNSRIPEMKLSTVHEDALRRDFTINALYYNIHTKQVEDYVGVSGEYWSLIQIIIFCHYNSCFSISFILVGYC